MPVALLDVTHDVLDLTKASSTTSRRYRQAISEMLSRLYRQRHDPKVAEQRQRHGHAGITVAHKVAGRKMTRMTRPDRQLIVNCTS